MSDGAPHEGGAVVRGLLTAALGEVRLAVPAIGLRPVSRIDLFVAPEHRGAGLGRVLMVAAMRACAAAGDSSLSLRVGDGTSAAAHRLDRSLGFRPPAAAPSP